MPGEGESGPFLLTWVGGMKYVCTMLLLVGCGQAQISGQAAGPQDECQVTQNLAGALITCPSSAPVQVYNGSTGAQGSQGVQGVAGIAGTVVTAVQFCPGYTPTYPSTFPEVGFCIGGSLYAEYYAPPSSGLTLLTPGAYASTQTGAPCNFTVVQGCQIQ